MAALLASPGLPDVAGFVTLGMPSTTAQLRDRLAAFAPQLATGDTIELEVAGNKVTIGRRLLDDLARHDVGRAAGALARPLLILHSPEDRTVPVAHAARVFRRARHPKSFVALGGADHLLLERERDAEYVAAVVAAFSDRFAV
jgi:putative redox protein